MEQPSVMQEGLSDTPERRRRMSIARNAVFTVAMAGEDARRRFLIRQRLVFLLVCLAGLGALPAAALLLQTPGPDLVWLVAGGSLFCLGISVVARLRSGAIQLLGFVLGVCGVGFAVGLVLPKGTDLLNYLMNPIVVVGALLVGATVNRLLFRRERSSWVDFLLCGPWLALGLAGAWFFPAGELVLAVSVLVGLALAFCLFRAGPESLKLYQPGEWAVSAADLVPLTCIVAFRGFAGRD